MKLILSILLMAPVFASAATEIIYNRSANPYIPEKGAITRDRLCVDEQNNALQVHVPPSESESCETVKTDYSRTGMPIKVCVGRKSVKVPAMTLTAPLNVKKEVCVQWNRNDSSRPTCVKTEVQEVQLDDSYTQYSYDPSDYRKERPYSVENKRLELCDK
ncbi:hypothetical protein B9G69_009395 [Bdellovibrio sp. SKB1291214]|uniref:hypothetical protein n=1 Tax=Bdellovibrio sp. SKB1291214 TaxID=1732569 RepID=UPI000B51BDA1|nr:hypothetical protein [Bdellovibrio sp. SKB1291214]UYL07260.1 hypothetical protein B9G69_009395 [Bdellovibrio sp. SKB1291214]